MFADVSFGRCLLTTFALTILAAVAAASLWVWAALVLAIVTYGGSIAGRVEGLTVVAAISAGFGFVITRMATRHEFGVAYRALWICVPVLLVGMLSLYGLLMITPVV